MVRVSLGDISYDWNEGWAKVPRTESATRGWAHHGVVVRDGGQVVSFHQADRTLLVLDVDGKLLRTHQTDLTEGHGMTLVNEGGTEYLWVADNGSKRQASLGYEYPPEALKTSGRVVKMRLDGSVVASLPKPNLEEYKGARFSPTSVAVDEERFGGNGDIWVADGYGVSYVHRYRKDGTHLGFISGEAGGGRFNTPHAVFIDRRKGRPELYVADRSNKRVQVYDLEGHFLRTFGSDFLSSPSAFAPLGDRLVIAELRARLVVVDRDDKVAGYLGSNEQVCEVDGWPNRRNGRGEQVAPESFEPGKFNSPHGLATDDAGNIYVEEWLIGGRSVKLARA